METKTQPLVSILTPVYNGAEYLAECIESVLAQTYQNWDYTIINNCSTDESLAIAQKYAARDSRIRVVTNDRFLRIIENHNQAVRQMTPDAKYCKFVFADDWLFPHCVEEMVRTAETNPSVGLIGAYTMNGEAVIWPGPAYPGDRIPGREFCRKNLLGAPYVFGTMTSLMVRSDLIRKRAIFFNEHNLHADYEVCFDVLQDSDFAYVHQVLCFSRPQADSNGAFALSFNSITMGVFVVFLKYGPVFLSQADYQRRYDEICWQYHRELGHNVLRIRPKEYWKYHQDTLAAFDARINYWMLTRAVFMEAMVRLSHPIHYLRKGLRWWSQRLSRIFRKGSVQIQRLP
jgi:glycosyltransferase involved in cell wall biosynthesis